LHARLVEVALHVRILAERLCGAVRGERPARHEMLSWSRVAPRVVEHRPRAFEVLGRHLALEVLARRVELRRMPRVAAVDRDLDALDRRVAAPRPAREPIPALDAQRPGDERLEPDPPRLLAHPLAAYPALVREDPRVVH